MKETSANDQCRADANGVTSVVTITYIKVRGDTDLFMMVFMMGFSSNLIWESTF